MDEWLHLLHVLGAMVWVGGGATLAVMGLRARSGADPYALGVFARTLAYVGLRILLPAVVVVLVTGVWMVLISSDFHFSQAWVRLALGLFALAFLVGAVYLSRVGIALERAASVPSPAAVAALDRWLVGYGVVLAVLVVAVWDMVFKPGT